MFEMQEGFYGITWMASSYSIVRCYLLGHRFSNGSQVRDSAVTLPVSETASLATTNFIPSNQ